MAMKTREQIYRQEAASLLRDSKTKAIRRNKENEKFTKIGGKVMKTTKSKKTVVTPVSELATKEQSRAYLRIKDYLEKHNT